MFVSIPSIRGGYVSIPVDHIFLIVDAFDTKPPDPPVVEVEIGGKKFAEVNDADPDYMAVLKECGAAATVHFYRGAPNDTAVVKTSWMARRVVEAIEQVRQRNQPTVLSRSLRGIL